MTHVATITDSRRLPPLGPRLRLEDSPYMSQHHNYHHGNHSAVKDTRELNAYQHVHHSYASPDMQGYPLSNSTRNNPIYETTLSHSSTGDMRQTLFIPRNQASRTSFTSVIELDGGDARWYKKSLYTAQPRQFPSRSYNHTDTLQRSSSPHRAPVPPNLPTYQHHRPIAPISVSLSSLVRDQSTSRTLPPLSALCRYHPLPPQATAPSSHQRPAYSSYTPYSSHNGHARPSAYETSVRVSSLSSPPRLLGRTVPPPTASCPIS